MNVSIFGLTMAVALACCLGCTELGSYAGGESATVFSDSTGTPAVHWRWRTSLASAEYDRAGVICYGDEGTQLFTLPSNVGIVDAVDVHEVIGGKGSHFLKLKDNDSNDEYWISLKLPVAHSVCGDCPVPMCGVTLTDSSSFRISLRPSNQSDSAFVNS